MNDYLSNLAGRDLNATRILYPQINSYFIPWQEVVPLSASETLPETSIKSAVNNFEPAASAGSFSRSTEDPDNVLQSSQENTASNLDGEQSLALSLETIEPVPPAKGNASIRGQFISPSNNEKTLNGLINNSGELNQISPTLASSFLTEMNTFSGQADAEAPGDGNANPLGPQKQAMLKSSLQYSDNGIEEPEIKTNLEKLQLPFSNLTEHYPKTPTIGESRSVISEYSSQEGQLRLSILDSLMIKNALSPGSEPSNTILLRPQVNSYLQTDAPGPPSNKSNSEKTTIRVNIGRIEVRAVMPDRLASKPQQVKSAPVLSLQDYLKQRNGG